MKHHNMIAKNQRHQSKSERIREKALQSQKFEKIFPEESVPDFAHTLAQEFSTEIAREQLNPFEDPMIPITLPVKPKKKPKMKMKTRSKAKPSARKSKTVRRSVKRKTAKRSK